MKLTVSPSEVVPELSMVDSVVDSRNPLHAASLARLRTIATADWSLLEIAGVSHASSIRTVVPCEMESPGEVLVNAGELAKRLQKFKCPVKLEASGGKLKVSAAKLRYALNTVSADEWPTLQTPKGDTVSVPAGVLRECIERCGFAVPPDDARSISALFLRAKDGELMAVGIDGHRFAMFTVPFEWPLSVEISQSGIRRISRLIDKCDGDVVLSENGSTAFAQVGETVLGFTKKKFVLPPIERLFPRLFPEGSIYETEVSRDELKEALSAASLAGVERDTDGKMVGRRDVRVRVTFAKTITVESDSPEYGEAVAECSGSIDGEVVIGLNSRYAVEALSACDETVRVRINGDLDPIVFESGGARHVVSPVRL